MSRYLELLVAVGLVADELLASLLLRAMLHQRPDRHCSAKQTNATASHQIQNKSEIIATKWMRVGRKYFDSERSDPEDVDVFVTRWWYDTQHSAHRVAVLGGDNLFDKCLEHWFALWPKDTDIKHHFASVCV